MATIKNAQGENVTLFKDSIVKIKTSENQTTIYFVDGSTEVFNYNELEVARDILPNLK